MTIATTFTTTCPCGVTVHFIDGVELSHTCEPIPPQAVRDAYAEGYGVALDMARKDAQRIVDLVAERDAAREECGHEKAMRDAQRQELDTFVNLRIACVREHLGQPDYLREKP